MSQNLNNGEDTKYTKYLPYIDRNYNMVMLLGLTINMIAKALQEQVKESGLTAVEYELLILVKELGNQAIPAELSRILLRKPPATTTLLNRMEKSGLVKRKAHPDSKKIKIVVMTMKGQEALETAGQRNVLHDIIGALPHQKFENLWDLLEEIKEKATFATENLTTSSP
ncbi:MarR family winged helix-turn-helix transcriptional regulator [Chloroflexota bacterium]